MMTQKQEKAEVWLWGDLLTSTHPAGLAHSCTLASSPSYFGYRPLTNALSHSSQSDDMGGVFSFQLNLKH